MSETGEASNEAPEPKSKGVTFKFGSDVEMQETEALGAEDDTEGREQAEDDTDAIMGDWDEEAHTPTIQVEVEKAWSKLPKASKAKNTRSEWISKDFAAKKLVCMEDHRKERGRANGGAGG